ncbi:hypothetical protein [Puniceicoccus vermicola]|uniref:Uncharacterized protein n=1 Tax=Puniceicoccus vermicola TaxID=388746 RepID=A0A7X1AZ02_9BACT|nr:hypothetical protein [Puniceicoccus vermicola]MBC2602581.1 hypothetical protein [Puniceicoccus vermicola]
MGTDLVCPRSVRASNNETGKVNPHRYHAIPKIFLQQSKRFCIAIYERDSGAISEHCRYAAKLDAGYTSDNNGGFTFLCWIDLTPVNR